MLNECLMNRSEAQCLLPTRLPIARTAGQWRRMGSEWGGFLGQQLGVAHVGKEDLYTQVSTSKRTRGWRHRRERDTAPDLRT